MTNALQEDAERLELLWLRVNGPTFVELIAPALQAAFNAGYDAMPEDVGRELYSLSSTTEGRQLANAIRNLPRPEYGEKK